MSVQSTAETAGQEPESHSEIGKLLRYARLQSRLSLEQVSTMLHIRVRYLQALEEGRLSELPGLTYTRGYLQSYAAFLGLDKDELLRRFEEMEALLGRKGFYFPQVFSRDKSPNRWMIWGSLGAALLVYGVWALFLQNNAPRISQVERLPAGTAQVLVSAKTLRDVACLQSLDVLYPPCTMAKRPFISMIPQPDQTKSIMFLASPGSL